MADLSTEAKKLRQFIERIERLEGEKKEISEEVSGIYKDLQQDGFDSQAIKDIIRARKQDERKRREREELVDHYQALLERDI
jgi:uncharacterized protein (UPF0335 family)